MNRRRMITKILAGFIAMSMLAADVTADVAATELINTKAIESESVESKQTEPQPICAEEEIVDTKNANIEENIKDENPSDKAETATNPNISKNKVSTEDKATTEDNVVTEDNVATADNITTADNVTTEDNVSADDAAMLTDIEDSTAVVNNGSMLDGDTKEEIVADVDDDPLYERYLAQQSIPADKLISISQVDIEKSDDELSLDSMSDFPVGNYTHKYTASAGYDIKRGVDVSKYQGTINWSAAKADGVEFAFIRVGFRGYGASGSLNEDTTYKSNISGAIKAGIPVGVYMFSQAITVAEAQAEADYILARIKSYNITLPVIMDFEYSGNPGRLRAANLSKAEATSICNAFCKKAADAGYEAMVYANYDMLTNHLNASQIADKYKIWIARWNRQTGYSGEYKAWQFTDAGTVNGISGAVDLDFLYDKTGLPVKLHANGGVFESGEDIDAIVLYGKSVADYLQQNGIVAPQKVGAKFLGWSKSPTSAKADYNATTAVNAAGLELYAVWEDAREKLSKPEAYIYDGTGVRQALTEAGVNSVDPGSKIALSTGTDNAEIYYCIGTSPAKTANPTSESGIRYTSPIRADEGVVIKAVSVKDGYYDSDTAILTVSVNDMSENLGQILEEDLPGDEAMPLAERIALVPAGFWTSEIDDVTYTGTAIKPTLRVYYGKNLLEEKKDYTLKYANNVNSGVGTVTVTGKSGYSGVYVTEFTIAKRDISAELSGISPIAVIYNAKKNQSPSFSVTVGGKKLTLNRDYIIDSIVQKAEPSDIPCVVCKEPGTYIYNLSAKASSNYSGSGSFEFRIKNSEVTLVSALTFAKIPDQSFDATVNPNVKNYGNPNKPLEVRFDTTSESCEIVIKNKAKQKIDLSGFDFKYENNAAVGTATVTVIAKDDNELYAGSKSQTFKITGYPMNKVTVLGINPKTGATQDISKYLSYEFTGKPVFPLGVESDDTDTPESHGIEISYAPSKGAAPIPLTKGVDYSVSYLNNIKSGTATVKLVGKGRFTGTLSKSFKITDYKPIDAAELPRHIFVEFVGPDSTKSGDFGRREIACYKYVKNGLTPVVKVYFEPDGGVTSATTAPSANAVLLTQNTDYSISYSNNKAIGEYDAVNKNGKSVAPTIKITGKKSFSGSISANFTIIPRDIGMMNMSVGDRVATDKVNQYTVTPAITDPFTGKDTKLASGTDYEKTFKYTYAETVRIKRYDSKTKKTTYAIAVAGNPVGPTDIIPVGATLRVTVTGRGNYTGEISRTYSVAAYDIAKATVNVANQTYSGVPVMPDKSDITSISMKIGKNVVPLEAYEYEIVPGSYKKNTAAGTGTMQIHGRGQYCGYKTVNFKIAARSMYYNISFFANGGTGTMKTQNISKSGTELTKNAYKRTGYDFLGWNTKEDGTGITYADKDRIGIVVAGGNLSLHAMWREKE